MIFVYIFLGICFVWLCYSEFKDDKELSTMLKKYESGELPGEKHYHDDCE